MSPPPSTMRALVIQQLGKPKIQSEPVPQPKDGEILVKVSHVALHLDTIGTPGAILGCDYAGVVAAVGSGVSMSPGDRVCGVIYGGKILAQGSFAEFLVTREQHAFAIPRSVSDAEATTYGIGFSTAAMALFHDQGYSYASEQRDGWFLVNGGSTSVGLFALALLRYLGIKSIATASPHSFDLVKSYGADHVIDYHDSGAAVTRIKHFTSGGVVAGLECIAGDGNFEISVKAFGAQGGRLTSLLPPSDQVVAMRSEVIINNIMLPTAFGRPIGPMPALPEAHAWFTDFVKRAQGESGLITEIKANPIQLEPGGLEGIIDGLHSLRSNNVSGKKLVYKIADE